MISPLDLAAFYQECLEIETVRDEIKTHLAPQPTTT